MTVNDMVVMVAKDMVRLTMKDMVLDTSSEAQYSGDQ